MAFDNFTVNVISFNSIEGTDWTQAQPSVTLTITPDAGYKIDVADFSSINPLPTYVSTVSYSQSGSNIECLITYEVPSEMPSNDVLIALCITGSASLVTFSVGGIIYYYTAFTSTPTPPSANTPYSQAGIIYSTAEIANPSVVATSGYYFPVLPTASLTVGTATNYSIVPTLINDSEGNLIQVNFAVNYTFPDSSVTGDIIIVNAVAEEIYVPIEGISSYSMDTSLIAITGETRTMTVFGTPDSVFTVAMDGVNLVTSITMDANGSYSFPVVFPSVTTSTSYEILLSGDLVSPFVQDNPFTILQKANTEVTLGVILPSGIPSVSSVVKSYLPFQQPPVGSDAQVIEFSWTAAPTGGRVLLLASQPNDSYWSNLDTALNGGTEVFPVAIVDRSNPPTDAVIYVTGTIDTYGSSNMTTSLDLTSLITVLKPISLFYGIDENEACCDPDSVSHYILESETFSTAQAILLVDGSAAPDGFYVEQATPQ
jgi:hypothetical protein